MKARGVHSLEIPHSSGWQPVVFHHLTETQQLWMEGGQHSIKDLFHEDSGSFREFGLLGVFGFFNLVTTCWTSLGLLFEILFDI